MTDKTEILTEALIEIARGHPDGGRPLGGAKAEDIARVALVKAGIPWSAEGAKVYEMLGEVRKGRS